MQNDTLALIPVPEKGDISVDHTTGSKDNVVEQTNSNPRSSGSSGRALKTATTAKPKIIEDKMGDKAKAVMPAKGL